MRILTVTDFLYPHITGGASVLAHEIMRRLAMRGHEVVLLTRRRRGLPSHVEGMPVHSYWAATREALYPLALVHCVRRVSAMLDGGGFDLVNVHHSYSGLGVEASRRLCSTVPSVFYFHGPWHKEAMAQGEEDDSLRGPRALKYAARRAADRFVLRSCTRCVVLSQYMRSEAMSICPGVDGRVTRIPGGVDTERFHMGIDRRQARERLRWRDAETVLLTVRRLAPRMGLENLIRAMDLIRSSRPEVRLVIGGKGPLAERLQALINSLGLTQVELAGYIPDEDLPAYYRAADLAVMPSESLEGFGLSTLEAFACGTPVVATPVGGNGEVLGGPIPDFILDGSDPDHLARGILSGIDKLTRPDLSARLRQHAERHSWSHITDEVEELFAQVCAGDTGR